MSFQRYYVSLVTITHVGHHINLFISFRLFRCLCYSLCYSMRTISQEQAATRPICLNGLWRTKSSLDQSIIPDVRRLRNDSALTAIAKELHSCSPLMWKEEKPHGVRVRRTRKRNGKGVAIETETYRRNDPVVFFQLSKLLRNYDLINDLTAYEKTVP